MKNVIFIILLFISYNCFAQSDYLILKLKSGGVDSIPIITIQSIKFESTTSITDNEILDSDLRNYPNPFSENTTIEFIIESNDDIEVIIYNSTGRVIRKLPIGKCPAGKNEVKWDTKNQKGEVVANGVYYYEIHTSHKVFSKQMIKVGGAK